MDKNIRHQTLPTVIDYLSPSFLNVSNFLLSFLSGRLSVVGRESRSSCIILDRLFRLLILDPDSLYSLIASLAGPRFSERFSTTTFHSYGPFRISSISLTWMRREDFARDPLTNTLPRVTASVASVRVLKNLAAHNHLSRRMESGLE